MLKLAAVCLGAALLSSCSRNPAVEAAHELPAVAVAPVKTEDLSRSVELTAEFKPYQDVDVMAKVAGYVNRSTWISARA